ncbi:TPR repeat protein [Bradyrhizobium sp. USDA 4341]
MLQRSFLLGDPRVRDCSGGYGMRPLIIVSVLANACLVSACSRDISGAVDNPPLFPIESVQPADAYWQEGASHATGHGLLRNEEAAVVEYERAAERNDVRATVDLGMMYAQGRGVARDYGKAVSLFRRASDAGSAAAKYNLALLHLSGEGVSVDPAQAVSLLRSSARQGHLKSMTLLAELLETGAAPPRDAGEISYWRREAASRGDRGEIARMVDPAYRSDPRRPVVTDAVRRMVAESCRECTAPEIDRSTREYAFVTTGRNAGTIYQLAIRNRDGDGIPRDLREAARLFAVASQMGHAPSQYELARLRIDGIGVARDYREAEALLIAASRSEGSEARQARDLRRRLEYSLSRSEIDDAMKRADLRQFGDIDQYGRPR